MIQAELTCSAVWALQASVMPASNHDRQLPARRNRSIHRRLRAHGAMQGRQVMLSVISWIFPGLGGAASRAGNSRRIRTSKVLGGLLFQQHDLFLLSVTSHVSFPKERPIRTAETPVVLCIFLHASLQNVPCPLLVPPVLCKALKRVVWGSLHGF